METHSSAHLYFALALLDVELCCRHYSFYLFCAGWQRTTTLALAKVR